MFYLYWTSTSTTGMSMTFKLCSLLATQHKPGQAYVGLPREMFFADMKAVPDESLISAYVNTGETPNMYMQEGKKHQARVNSNYRINNMVGI